MEPAERKSRGWVGRTFDVGSFALQQVASNWAAISTYAFGAMLLSVLAYIQQLPPLLWGAAFFAGLIGVGIFRLISAFAARTRAHARMMSELAKSPTSVNSLQKDFSNQRISLSDFWHALFPMRNHIGQTFRNCHIIGPATICLEACYLIDTNWETCDLIYWPPSISQTSILFRKAYFEGCYFAQVTIYLPGNVCEQVIADAAKQGQPKPHIRGFTDVDKPSRSPKEEEARPVHARAGRGPDA